MGKSADMSMVGCWKHTDLNDDEQLFCIWVQGRGNTLCMWLQWSVGTPETGLCQHNCQPSSYLLQILLMWTSQEEQCYFYLIRFGLLLSALCRLPPDPSIIKFWRVSGKLWQLLRRSGKHWCHLPASHHPSWLGKAYFFIYTCLEILPFYLSISHL